MAIALIIILFPIRAIGFYRKTDEDVKEVVKEVKNILISPVIQHLVKKIYGKKLILTVDNSFEINTDLNTSTRGTSQLTGMGIKTSITR